MTDTSKWTFIGGPPSGRLRLFGELETRGWDIPTRWAVDESLQCWQCAAHGATLHKVSSEDLILTLEEEGDEHNANAVRALLGQPQHEPLWMKQARAHGWKPPE